jgi:hypothetical protein
MKANPILKAVLAIIFVSLIAVPLVLRRLASKREKNLSTVDVQSAINRYGVHFDEVAQSIGINFTHQAPTLDHKLDHIMPQVASMGAAVSVVDFDRDGWPDIYATNSGEGSKNALYRNQQNGTFKDVANEVGLADVNQQSSGVSMGAVWGDYDNDGFEDVFIYKWGKPELFHNESGKSFTRVTDQANFPSWVNANTAIWFDYDADGKIDLFLGGYYADNVDLWHLKDTRMMPESFEYARNGGRKYLFHNLGNGSFEEVSQKLGIDTNRWALAAVAADLRGSGHPDLFIANDYGISELYFNDGKQFREAGKQAGVGFSPKSGMNATVGDVLNSGRYSIYVSNISEEGVLIQGNNLWMPREGTSGDSIQYDNLARDLDVEIGGWSFGAQFGDLNNDGNQDLYLVNGYVSADRNKNYWYDFSKITGGNSSIISDAANWPAMEGRSLSGYQQKHVWLNDGSGKFVNVATAVGVSDINDGRSVALVDLWNRGVLDVVVANQKGPLLVYKSTVSSDNQWIDFQLEGSASNRSAIGAQVKVFWNGKQQLQTVMGGSGFCAQNDRRLHFGLGKNPRVEKVEIRWPSGRTQTIDNVAVGQINKVKES